MKSIPLILSISMMSVLLSCTSTPYKRRLTPNINGVILINSEPAADIKLYLSLDSKDLRCDKFVKMTITNSQGEFDFPAVKQQMSYTPLMTYYLNEWLICAELHGSRQMIYSDNYYGQGSVTGSIQLNCDSRNKSAKQLSCRHQSLPVD